MWPTADDLSAQIILFYGFLSNWYVHLFCSRWRINQISWCARHMTRCQILFFYQMQIFLTACIHDKSMYP